MSHSNNIEYPRVLAIDTATRYQLVGLIDGDEVMESRARKVPYEHSSDLLGSIHEVLHTQGLGPKDVHLIAVGVGPGSFTGLRVAMAVAKGLARAANIPLVGVSTLAALAARTAWSAPGQPVCAALDARRAEVWAGIWTADPSGLISAHTPDGPYSAAALRAVLDATPDAWLVGHQTHKYEALHGGLSRALPAHLCIPDPAALALIGRQRARAGLLADLRELEPNYLRPSDAEMNPKFALSTPA
jgi:tRNA threonylcarbamoyladenosine biosynthesis protein TsaB